MDASARRLKVFLVENHDDTLNYLSLYLAAQGHEVSSARDMATALESVPQSVPDVFLCDIGLPDGDGWELMRRLREAGHAPYAIAMSGYNERERSLAAGFHDHLTKPFLPEELEAALAQARKAQENL